MSREQRAARLRVRPLERGYVELAFVNGEGEGEPLTSADGGTARIVLQYPAETLLGADPREVVNARQLQRSATALNAMLLELAS